MRFATDKDVLAEKEQELEALVESFDKTCPKYFLKDTQATAALTKPKSIRGITTYLLDKK